MRSTLNAVPLSNSLLKKSKLPFSLVISPYTSLHDAEDPIPVVSDHVISRCRRCRSYINPFVTFVDNNTRWKCNLCSLYNDVPQQFYWNPVTQQQSDIHDRYELQHSAVEFVAPQEYMVRPPQALIYFFLIDVSIASVNSGLLGIVSQCILNSLDRIPNAHKRTRVGFVGVDSGLNFFLIPRDDSGRTEPEMMVVSDLEEPFVPTQSDLLVSLIDCRANIERFLSNIQTMFQDTRNDSSAMGSALRTGHTILSGIGGKMTVVTASLPTVGHASLSNRQGSEPAMLQPANNWYKSFAVECCKEQISVDMFLCSTQYQDVATLSNLPRFTSGQTYYYPAFNAIKKEHAYKFSREFSDYLSTEIGLEAVLRVRASAGLRMNSFYGNFFSRSSDLCAFPAFPRDQAYVVEVSIDEPIPPGTEISMQAAVLHTTCNGERRIRVITLCLPSTDNLSTIYAGADQQAIVAYYSHKAVERALSHGPDSSREMLQAKLIEIVQTYRKEVAGGSGFSFPANLRALPTLFLALMKSTGLRKSAQLSFDVRAAALCLLSTLPVPLLMKYIYPRMYSLHDMPEEAGTVPPGEQYTLLPQPLNLNSTALEHHGLYLIDNGQYQVLWLGRDAVPELIFDLFSVEDKSAIRQGMMTLFANDNDFNARVRDVIERSHDYRPMSVGSINYPVLHFIREDGDPGLLMMAHSLLIESQLYQQMGIDQWIGLIREKVSS